MTTELTGFLLARIAEDEAGSVIAVSDWGGCDIASHWSRARVLAECEAKRRIVDGWLYADPELRRHPWTYFALRAISTPYADHPDYRPEWKL